ncbi:MAG: hypothetical protein AAGA80_17380 [Cyanobacteria bacterium P01_F01_bin.143]
MKSGKTKLKSHIPDWQLERVKTIIANRWDEVWKIVVERDRFDKKLQSYYHNSDF